MNFSRRHVLGALVTGAASLASPVSFAATRPRDMPRGLDRAMAALDSHAGRIPHRDILGLVDFNAPSGEPRFRLVDVGNGRILSDFLVAHGRGSDPANTGMLQRFSNRPGSNASCQGSFLIGDAYYGKHGRSRRIHGLDPENSLAYERAIVIHSAPYVSEAMARSSGRVGRSLGCFTVTSQDLGAVMTQLAPGRLLYAHK
ncbi:murein L,D-transpeptidase catalytic domain family protein [Novosphingobium profundi]|uniref:murein L,D-transpeptidase catalytic domain family protein n=1 Tax=Novosphingobium profundi TaxID=1774954 RepID=UPI001BDAC4FD|nr:murein L,D-transpeptidase catalytic domain family protein [Novosphingobium profundi]MBT0669065.1 murein L,D-transpeptidase catalytic domain family protein [Novosphingobium profundi]